MPPDSPDNRARAGEAIELVAPRPVRPVLPAAPWSFAAAMAAAIAIAVFAGLVLAFLAAAETGFGATHWTEAVQAHGRLQVFGFASVFVAALTFEFGVRLNQHPPLPIGPRVAALALVGLGALVGSAGQVWYGSLSGLWAAGAALTFLGAGLFTWLIFPVRSPRPLRADPVPLWFRSGAVWFLVAATLSLATALRADFAVAPIDETRLTSELLLRGFVLNIILAVGTRAFPGHLDLPMVPARRQLFLWSGVNAGALLWALGSGAFGLPELELVRTAGDFALAAALLGFTAWQDILRPLAGPLAGPRYRLLIPVAWLGAVLYALGLIGFGVTAPFWDASLYQEGAIRHIFLLGFMAPLMIAMAHIVLARFGTGRVISENLLTTAFVLLMLAWPLRVVPALLQDAPGELARAILGTAAVLAIAGFALAAVVSARNAIGIRARHVEMQRHQH